MKEHSKNILDEIDELFVKPPSANRKAWGIINEFYHLILTHMEEQNITKAELAKKLGRSRSAISQMFNKTPNITVRKMVEIADSIGLDIDIVSSCVKKEMGRETAQSYTIVRVSNDFFSKRLLANQCQSSKEMKSLITCLALMQIFLKAMNYLIKVKVNDEQGIKRNIKDR